MHKFKHCKIELGQEADKLTGPQKAVVLLLAFGLSNKAIGTVISRSPETVKSHVDALLERFNVDSRAGIVGQAFCHGVLKASSTTKAFVAAAFCSQGDPAALVALGSQVFTAQPLFKLGVSA